MKIRTFLKAVFWAGLVLTAVLWLLNLYGSHIENTQTPIADYQYDGYEGKINYKRSNIIQITYKSKQYRIHAGDRILDKIESGDFPKLYYSSETDYLFFEGDYMPVGYAEVALLFAIIFLLVGAFVYRKQLDDDVRAM